ncbi:MAG: hypothetical protein AAF391_11480, partial [Bacteroidota bacterium]
MKVSWLDRASFQDILVFDLKGDTMLYAQRMSIEYDLWDLVNGDYLTIEEITSNTVELHLVKYDSLSRLNISEFINSLKNDTSRTKESTPIQIGQVDLQDFELTIDNRTKEQIHERMDFSHLTFNIKDVSVGLVDIRKDTIEG